VKIQFRVDLKEAFRLKRDVAASCVPGNCGPLMAAAFVDVLPHDLTDTQHNLLCEYLAQHPNYESDRLQVRQPTYDPQSGKIIPGKDLLLVPGDTIEHMLDALHVAVVAAQVERATFGS
jgi:hypothetical protein